MERLSKATGRTLENTGYRVRHRTDRTGAPLLPQGGSPIGRAGVFSLYWTKDEGNARRRYGFKLEYLLPLKEDNDNEIAGGSRERMIGVAVSPVQGMFDKPRETAGIADPEQSVHQPRRWRLLMYYMDHNVLSYELSKPRESQSPDPGELVV